MSVPNQRLDQLGCFGFSLAPADPSFGSSGGVSRQHDPIAQAAQTYEDKRKKQEIDALLSDAMSTLTFEERQEQQEVLHGVEEEIPEEATFIESALYELEQHLLRIKTGSVYEIAEGMNPEYVHARAFRIMFLRGQRYDTKAAANQMLKFFETKQDLFGWDKLTKDITFDDLDEDDIACLKTGWLQFAWKDRSGRIVLLQFLHIRAFKILKNEMRMKFYMLMDLLQSNEEAQLKGLCGLNYAAEDCSDVMNGAGYFEHIDLTNAIPVYLASVHFCCSKISEYLFCNLGIKAMPPKLRARFRLHFGSHLECQYRLSTYGLSGQNLPLIPVSNKVDMRFHRAWCQAHLKNQGSGALMPKHGIQPTSRDVLYMGGNRSNNAGNIHLRNLVADLSNTYDSGTNETKRRIVNEMVDKIHKSGGRFLSQVDGHELAWVSLRSEEVRSKITQMFRNRRRMRGSRKKKFDDAQKKTDSPFSQ